MLRKKGLMPSSWRCGWPATLALALAAVAPLSAREAPHPLELTGFQPGRGYLSVLPGDSIDVFSGGVVMNFTDLILAGGPGVQGRTLGGNWGPSCSADCTDGYFAWCNVGSCRCCRQPHGGQTVRGVKDAIGCRASCVADQGH